VTSGSGAGLALLTPDPEDDVRYDDWREQAALIEGVLPGLDIAYRPWSAPFESASLTLPVMAWGYHRHLDHWYAALDAWEATGARFANPVPVLRWNTDKCYLLDLNARGIPAVPTVDVPTLDAASMEAARRALSAEEFIVKPPVSAGSDDTFRLSARDTVPAAAMGRRMLVQPLMTAILDQGEWSLFYLGGALAHCIVKRAKSGDFRVQPQFGGQVTTENPPRAATDLAEAALALVSADVLYARVDLVADGDTFRIMELELIEPWLYLHKASDGGRAFAEAVRKAMA
jgi:glutathione synthase/RimK-type ligase-like ATP-grasp enzyme